MQQRHARRSRRAVPKAAAAEIVSIVRRRRSFEQDRYESRSVRANSLPPASPAWSHRRP
jgi:hypothetical protein